MRSAGCMYCRGALRVGGEGKGTKRKRGGWRGGESRARFAYVIDTLPAAEECRHDGRHRAKRTAITLTPLVAVLHVLHDAVLTAQRSVPAVTGSLSPSLLYTSPAHSERAHHTRRLSVTQAYPHPLRNGDVSPPGPR